MSDKKYVSLNKLKIFLDNLKSTFSHVSHTHTKSEIIDFNEQDIVDKVMQQLPSAEGSEF